MLLVRVCVTEFAFRRGPSPADDGTFASDLRRWVTLGAPRLLVGARQRPTSHGRVIEVGNLEGLRGVAVPTLQRGPSKPELPGVDVVVTSAAITRNTPVARAASGFSVLGGRVMAAIALRRGMRPQERPDTVVNLGEVPSAGIMAVCTASLRHLLRKLIPMRIGMAIAAGFLGYLQIDARARSRMAGGARRSHVLAKERERRCCVEVGTKKSRMKPARRVAWLAFTTVGRSEFAPVPIQMAICAPRKGEFAEPSIGREIRSVTAGASGLGVTAGQRVDRSRVSRESHASWQPHPLNGAVTAVASPAERRIVHRPVAGHTLGSLRRRDQVPAIMARTECDGRVATGQTQTG